MSKEPPLPPHILADARQDRIHSDGKLIRAVPVRTGPDEPWLKQIEDHARSIRSITEQICKPPKEGESASTNNTFEPGLPVYIIDPALAAALADDLRKAIATMDIFGWAPNKKLGEPLRSQIEMPAYCNDCGTPDGGYHHPGCDSELCPACHWQSIAFWCKNWKASDLTDS